jgi:hypothetical protein
MSACPERDQLALLLAERLSGPEAGRVEAHVQTCGRCQQALADLSAGSHTDPRTRAAGPELGSGFLRRLREARPGTNDPGLTAPAPGGTAAEGWPTIAGYEVLGELGRGGMGVVYRARQVRLGRVVALKVLLAGAHAGEQERARFKAEAEAVARLQHPHIVQIYEVGEEEGRPYLALEHVDGGSLADRLRGTPLPAREAAGLVETLARAVHAAHEKGVVHRDLKPANVLLTADGTPKLTDFGLAKRLDVAIGQTHSGAIVGTPSYMAPEQAGGPPRQVGPAADVHALGAVLYELLTGRPPFAAETPLDTLLRVVGEEPVPPGRLRPGLPRDLETVCLKCLEKDPQRRYATAALLADDLRRFQNHEPIRARPLGPWGRGLKWARRRPAWAALLGVIVLAGLALAAAGLLSNAALRASAERERLRALDAETNQRLAEEQERVTRRHLYATRINVAQRLWQEGEVAAMLDVLQGLRPVGPGNPDLRGFEFSYLWRLAHRHGAPLPGHEFIVTGVAYSPDGRRLASLDGSGKVRVWDMADRREVFSRAFASSNLSGGGHVVAFSPDGKLLAAAGNPPSPRKGPAPGMSRPGPGEVRVWDVPGGKEVLTLRGPAGVVSGLVFSPDGRRLAVVGEGVQADFGAPAPAGEFKVWEMPGGKELLSRPGRGDVSFSADGRRLVTLGADGRPRVWDVAAGKEVLALPSTAHGVAFSPRGHWLATAGAEVRVWDATTGQEVRTLGSHKTGAATVAFSADGRLLVSAGVADGLVYVWEVRTGRRLASLPGHEGLLCSLAFRPDGR